jgi:hypothetical protein
MKKIFNFFVLLFLLPVLVSAQQLSGKGTIISVQGDTIECFIEIQKKQFSDVVKYKRNKDDRFKQFPLSYLQRIIIKDKVYENLFFVKDDPNGGKIYTSRICICVVDGFVKLYKESISMFYHGADGIVNTKNIKNAEDDTFYMVKGAGNTEEVYSNSKFFVKQSQKTFEECKEIVQSINEKKYAYNDIVKIVEGYNDFYYSQLLESEE